MSKYRFFDALPYDKKSLSDNVLKEFIVVIFVGKSLLYLIFIFDMASLTSGTN